MENILPTFGILKHNYHAYFVYSYSHIIHNVHTIISLYSNYSFVVRQFKNSFCHHHMLYLI